MKINSLEGTKGSEIQKVEYKECYVKELDLGNILFFHM